MKGIRKDMQQKISRLRSRSAERISKRILHRQKSTSNDNDNNSESEKQTEIEDQKPVFRMNRSFSGLPMYNQVHNGPFSYSYRLFCFINMIYVKKCLRKSMLSETK